MRTALLSGLISIVCVLGQAADAKSQLDAATHKQLTMLEEKFFGHTYEAEADDDRTQRIEKLIYGAATEGAASDRIKKLASVTYIDTRPDPVETPTAKAPTASKSSQVSPQPASQPKMQAKAPEPIPAAKHSTAQPVNKLAQEPADDSDVPPSKPGVDNYPHVTILEKEILGSTFVGQPLSGRIVRMETKAFGSPSKSADLGERTDNLEQFAEQKLHKKPFLADEMPDTVYDTTVANASSDADAGPEHPQPQSAYPHVTALENEILGQAAPDQPLEKRLCAMEVKAFGKASVSDDLGGRTDALERYAEKTLHKKPFGQDVEYETADGSPNKAPEGKGMKLLSMVGNSLLGMAGVNNAANGPGFATPGMGGGMGGMGMGPNAFGPMGGFGGPGGFSGVRVRHRQAPAPTQPSAADEPSGPVEDPAVRGSNPPPATARLATRVGWCEMHVFGHTSPNLHLAERLSQLNRELNFEPGKSSMELMDHIDALVKSAQAFRAPAANGPAISTAPGNDTD